MTNVLWPTIRKFNHFLKWFHAVLYTVLENHVPLPRFPETFSMWYRIVFGTKWHRFHYCCNLWWVQPLYCINTLDYLSTQIAKYMGPTWVLSAPDGPHVGPMNLAIREQAVDHYTNMSCDKTLLRVEFSWKITSVWSSGSMPPWLNQHCFKQWPGALA